MSCVADFEDVSETLSKDRPDFGMSSVGILTVIYGLEIVEDEKDIVDKVFESSRSQRLGLWQSK